MKTTTGASRAISIVIADDHPVFRQGLRHVIDAEPDLRILGEAGDGEEAIGMITGLRPHVGLLDINMPRKNGLDVAAHVAEKRLPVSLIILTMYDEEDVFNKAVGLGVKGYILKDSAVLDIINGIRTVARGEYFFSPSMSNHLMKRSAPKAEQLGDAIERLTPAERKILRLVAENKASAEIAEELYISERTVEHHRAHIREKLCLSGAYALVRFALQNKGLLD